MEYPLDLKINRTKEMLIDLRKAPTAIPALFIKGVKVERVTEYKYLGTVLDKKMNLKKKKKKKKKGRRRYSQKLSAKNIFPSKGKIS